MDKLIKVTADQQLIASKVLYADTPQLRKKGVLGKFALASSDGVLLVMPGRLGLSLFYSIHMFGVPFGLAAAWLDQEGNILEAKIARPGKMYFPPGFLTDTRYILEVHSDHLPQLKKSTSVQWEDPSG